MHVTGWAAQRLAEMTPEGHEAVIHVSLTDDHPWAQAVALIEALPAGAARKDPAPARDLSPERPRSG